METKVEKKQEEKRYATTTAHQRFAIDIEGQFSRFWRCVPEAGTPYAALFKPEYWSAVAESMALGDWIIVEPEDSNYTARLRVRSKGLGGIRVEEYDCKQWDRTEAPESLMEYFKVEWAGPVHKWRVVRLSDNDIRKHGFPSESEANAWLAENEKRLQVA